MKQHRQNILVTRPLSAQQIDYARQLGLEPIIKPAIEIKFPEYGDEIIQMVGNKPKAAWAFTSVNGVRALDQRFESGLGILPDTTFYAVGSKTREAIRSHGVDAKIPSPQNGKHLAELIIAEEESSVLYFHGNLSRDEMTNILRDHGVEVTEQEVYQTHIQSVKMPDETVSGILFYSPSAVEGFKQGKGFEDELPTLFAIGSTTAGALKEQTDQLVQIADQPDTKVLLQTVSEYVH